MARPKVSEGQTTMRHLLHEMRTPLGQIIGYSEMIQEEMEDRGQNDLVPDARKIQGAARKLLKLVEDVFQTGAQAAAPSHAAAEGIGDPGVALGMEPAGRASGGRLLVVDDEPDNRDLLARRLGKAGYQVTAVEDGTQALHAIESGDFDLVLLDVLMPDLSGLEVLQAIRRTRSVSELPVVMATALGGSRDTVEALHAGANDYVTKPFDIPVVLARVETQLALKRAAREIAVLARELEIRNAFIRRAFGRYVSDEVVDNLLENPEGLELRGEKRRVTILMSDLRGFSGLTESLAPAQVVSLLNRYLGSMAEIIQSHGGTIDEFLGDAILAFFGAPASHEDDAERAVAAGIAMQLAMEEVNQANRAAGLPEIEMGIGIATGEVIVGNIGSEKRTKYGAVGSPVNLASRIESYTLGGEVLICPETFDAVAEVVRAEAPRDIHPKGLEAPIPIRRVVGIGGAHARDLPDLTVEWIELPEEVRVRFALLEGKRVTDASRRGSFCALSQTGARLRSDSALPELGDLRIEILDGSGDPLPGAFYAKVVRAAPGSEGASLVRFTSRSPALEQTLAGALGVR